MRSGLDIFTDVPYSDGPVGLLTTAASLTRDGRTCYRALRDAGLRIATVFTPQFGYYGIGATREVIPDADDGYVPIYRLDGGTEFPAPEELASLSMIIVDLQDVGVRFHPFLQTLHHALHTCVHADVPITVLDRPNPLRGNLVEGPLLSSELLSHYAPSFGEIPLRHGLTLGETANWFNEVIGANLTVVRMEGWHRAMMYSDTGLPWTMPTPDLPTFESAVLYPAAGLLECLPVSAGHGTTLPYQQIGAPYIDAEVLSSALNSLFLNGLSFTPTWFRPLAGNFAGQPCEGVRIHVADPRDLNVFELSLNLISVIRELYPDQAVWLLDGETIAFDVLAGTSHIREQLENGMTPERIVSDCSLEASEFMAEAASYWLYE